MTDTNVEIIDEETGERESVAMDTLIGAYHAFGVLTNLVHLMVGHHDDMVVIDAEGDIAFVWNCPETCDADKQGTTVTWIPSEKRKSENLLKMTKDVSGYLLSDVIIAMTDMGTEVVHTLTSFRMRGDLFGFMEMR